MSRAGLLAHSPAFASSIANSNDLGSAMSRRFIGVDTLDAQSVGDELTAPPMFMPNQPVDLRMYPQPDRANYAHGPPVTVWVDGMPRIQLPLPVFLGSSTKLDLLHGDAILRPGNVQVSAVWHFVTYLNDMAFTPKNYPLLIAHDMAI